MDVWNWVADAHRALEEEGQHRLAYLLYELPRCTLADQHQRLEALYPEALGLARASGNQGHVLWFSRGVLDVYPDELTAFYDVKTKGFAANPHFPADWRPVTPAPAPLVDRRPEMNKPRKR